MKKILLGLSALLFAVNLQAAGIGGVLQVGGWALGYDAGDGGAYEGIDIVGFGGIGGANWGTDGDIFVAGVTGDFADLLAPLDAGKMADIDFAADAIAPLWQIGAVTFTLDRFTVNHIATGLEIYGKGTIAAAGYDDTVGTFKWNITALDGQTAFIFDAAVVPEPGVLALFGLGLLGLGLVKLKTRRS